MEINQKKLKRQLERQELWMKSGCSSTLCGCTGFGKTFEAILIIQRLHKKYPDAQVDVVVPGIDLLNDWIDPKNGHIVKHKLENVNCFVINTYIRNLHKPVLLVIDEIHHCGSSEFSKVFEVSGCKPVKERTKYDPFILGLTATLERIDGRHRLIEEYCPVVDTVTLEEAKREKYISDYIVYNWGLEFNEEDQKEYERQDSIFKNSFAKFNHNFGLALSCSFAANAIRDVEVPVKRVGQDGTTYTYKQILRKSVAEWRLWYAREQDWDGEKDSFWSPNSIAKYAQQFSNSMRARKNLIYNANCKIEAIKKLFQKFPVKTIVFGEANSFADKLEELFGNELCRAYHTNIQSETIRQELISKKGVISYKDKKLGKDKTKQRIKDLFEHGNLMMLATSRALNEGYDNAKIRLAIMAAFNSSKRDDTQRTGRGTRLDNKDSDKKAIVVNLYIIGSQEEKWLKEKQKDKQGIIWVTTIDEINLEEQLSINLANIE